MIAVPCRIKRLARRIGHRHRLHSGICLPPATHIGHRPVKRNVARVYPYVALIVRHGSGNGDLYDTVEHPRLLNDAGVHLYRVLGIGAGYSLAVAVGIIEIGDHGRAAHGI